MSIPQMAWRNLLNRLLQNSLGVFVVGMAVGLALLTVLLATGVQNGINRAAEPFDLLIGSKGNAQQLVINTVLLQGNPLNNVPHQLYDELRQDPGLLAVVPLGYGDSVQSLKIIGTQAPLFEFRNKPNDPPYFNIAAGRVFSTTFEAVLGAEAQKRLGLGVGQQFNAEHGDEAALPGEQTAESAQHARHPYTVVGLLAPTSSPADLGVYVDIASYWQLHEHHETIPGDTTGADAITAILVKPKVFPNDLFRVQAKVNARPDAQAVVPYQELYNLNRLVGQGQQILSIISLITLVMAGATIFMALYGGVVERRGDLAVLRALGASRRLIFWLVILEAGLVSSLGLLVGLGLGHLSAVLVAGAVRDTNGLQIILTVPLEEPLILLAMLLVGLVAGLLPALAAYRTEAAKYLVPA